MSTQSEKEPSVKMCKIEVRSSQPAGSPIHRASQGLLPGAPTKKGAAYLPYLERPTKPTSRGRGVHTYIPRLLQDFMKHKLKRGAPTKGTQPLRPLQIAASASNGAQTRSGRTYTYILTYFLPTGPSGQKLTRRRSAHAAGRLPSTSAPPRHTLCSWTNQEEK